ncbi:MAG: multidrug efflux system membrane fusion protein [Verrucomicrobiales bacterium]|jgi:multidrug efflux system membrane fusion protein
MRPVIRVVLPLLILLAAAFCVKTLMESKKDPRGFKPPEAVTRVEGTALKPQSYQVTVLSQGVVVPRTKSTLIPEVPGKIIEISSSLREGGFFEEDEVLLKIDPLDYQTTIVVAQRNVAQAEALIEQELARSQQAVENWKRLGKKGDPSPLALRKPQLAEAEAQVAAAKAELVKAERDLDRTIIRAPYAGRILEKQVDVGQYVNTGTTLALIYAIDYVEVRLPIRNEDLSFLDLPESYRNEREDPNASRPKVKLIGRLGGKEVVWEGRLVRVAGALEARSRQLFAVAQIDDPYAKRKDGTPPLKINLFVEAEIVGNTLTDVFVLPRNAVRSNNEVIVIDKESKLRRRGVEPMWMAEDVVVVAQGNGVEPGDVLCTTPIAFPADGASVLATIDGVEPPEPGKPDGPPKSIAGKGKPGQAGKPSTGT